VYAYQTLTTQFLRIKFLKKRAAASLVACGKLSVLTIWRRAREKPGLVSWALRVCSAEKMVSCDEDDIWVLYAVSAHLVCSAAGRDWPAVGLQLPGGRQPCLYGCERVER
jgi:hypothetical protein